MNFDPVSTYSLNKSLDEEYQFLHHKVQAFISSRDAKQPPVNSFDKWTSVDQKKFIVVYLYVQSKAIALGIVPYEGFCGSEEIAVNIKNLLRAFNLIPSDIRIAVTDSGADVNAASTLCGWFNFPCLTHVINLIAKKVISLPTDEEAAPNENDWNYNSESESESSQSEILSLSNNYMDAIRFARKTVRTVHNSPKQRDKLSSLQRAMEKPVLGVILDNTTRWNSLLDMLVRFQLLRPFLEIMFPSDLEDYDWHSLERCIKILRPSKESALLLQ